MSSLLEHCHGEKTHFSRNEKRTEKACLYRNIKGKDDYGAKTFVLKRRSQLLLLTLQCKQTQ